MIGPSLAIGFYSNASSSTLPTMYWPGNSPRACSIEGQCPDWRRIWRGRVLVAPRPPEEDGDEDIGFVEVSVVVSEAAVISREDHQGIVEEARSSQCCHHPAHIAVSCLGGGGERGKLERCFR